MDARLALSAAELAAALVPGAKLRVETRHAGEPSALDGDVLRLLTRRGEWVRRPAHVLRDAIRLLWPRAPAGENNTPDEWLTFTHEGAQWRLRQTLVYPDVAARPDLLVRAPATSDSEKDGWAAADAGDEWMRLEAAAYGTRGGAYDAGGSAQVAGLYLEDGAALGGDPHVAVRVSARVVHERVRPLVALV